MVTMSAEAPIFSGNAATAREAVNFEDCYELYPATNPVQFVELLNDTQLRDSTLFIHFGETFSSEADQRFLNEHFAAYHQGDGLFEFETSCFDVIDNNSEIRIRIMHLAPYVGSTYPLASEHFRMQRSYGISTLTMDMQADIQAVAVTAKNL